MSTDFHKFFNKLTAEFSKVDHILRELDAEAVIPRPGNLRVAFLLRNLRSIHQVGLDQLRQLRELLEGSGEAEDNAATVQLVEDTLQKVSGIIQRFASIFERS